LSIGFPHLEKKKEKRKKGKKKKAWKKAMGRKGKKGLRLLLSLSPPPPLSCFFLSFLFSRFFLGLELFLDVRALWCENENGFEKMEGAREKTKKPGVYPKGKKRKGKKKKQKERTKKKR